MNRKLIKAIAKETNCKIVCFKKSDASFIVGGTETGVAEFRKILAQDYGTPYMFLSTSYVNGYIKHGHITGYRGKTGLVKFTIKKLAVAPSRKVISIG